MNKLKALRKKAGKTQDEMANLLNINRTTYGKWELGTHNPDVNTVLLLSDYFDVTTDYLLGKSDDSTQPGKPKKELTLEEQILNNPDLSEEGKKIMLQQLILVKILDNVKTKNELDKEKFKLNSERNRHPNSTGGEHKKDI